jgi:non-ribosomal peptide synthetase component E (peptide arylation enzyme)
VHAFVVGAVPARLPVAMTVHVVDALPLTALGKVDKRRLRERVLVVQLPLP